MKWTKEQQEAIEIRGKNMLVSAAAGSGKTAVLVERIKQLIIRDQVPLDRMLVVTFSNAAASEMREKIVAAISRELEEQAEASLTPAGRPAEQGLSPGGHIERIGLPARRASFLREQLNLIHRANISTFHAFALEVIRRYFYLIDMEPNFRICDEAQQTILQAEAMEELFSSMFESGDQDFIDFLSKYALTKNDNAAREMIFTAHNFVQSIPDSLPWLREQAERLAYTAESFEKSPAYQEIRGEIARNLVEAMDYFARAGEILKEHGLYSLVPKWKLDMEALEALRESFDTLPFDEFGKLVSEMRYQIYSASKAEKEAYEEAKETVAALRDRGKAAVRKLGTKYFIRPLAFYIDDLNKTQKDALFLCHLVEEFDRLYKEKKRAGGLIDFSDIEHYALALLSREEAAAEYREKFEYIFIDEYQDSNIVQETLIGKIKRENNLFMVGDVKQSIYKFRLAEPEIFIRKYEAFRDKGNECDIKLDLNMNFRSKGRIIAAVNDIFRQIMKKDLSGLEYDDAAALRAGQAYEGGLDYPVELHIVDEAQIGDLSVDDEIREMKKTELEAYTAARIIRESRGLLIYDGKRSGERPISNRDIVILLRSARGYADIYYETLMKEGIPAFVDAGDGYFDTLEVEVFLNLLRVIDNRKQDIPLLSVLRPPIFGFAMEELIQIRIHNKEGAYHQAFQEYAETGGDAALKEKCSRALSRIRHWKIQAPLMPLEDFLWMLIRETGYYGYIGGIPGGSQRQANLRALADKAVQFQSSQMKGLFSFINYIEALKKRNVPMGQVKLLGENDDVVRIMTIHKSKGLEFPMVLVGGLGKRFNTESDTYQVSLHKDIGLGVRYVDRENSCFKKTIVQTAIDQKRKREAMAEELRILYVALTRAMDRLVLLGTLKDADTAIENYAARGSGFSGAKSYLDFIIPALERRRQSSADAYGFRLRQVNYRNPKPSVQRFKCRANIRLKRIAHGYSNRTSRFENTDIVCRRSNRKDISFRKEETEQKKSGIRRLILGGLSDGAGRQGPEATGQPEPESEDVRQLKKEGPEQPETVSGIEPRLKEEIQRRLGYEYGHPEALKLKSKFTVSELSRLAADGPLPAALGRAKGEARPGGGMLQAGRALILDTPKFTREKSRFTGAEKGTILHKVMERLDFSQITAIMGRDAGQGESSDAGENCRERGAARVTVAGRDAAAETVKDVVRDMVARELLTAEEAETVSYEKIIGFFDSEIGRRAGRAERLWKEASFNILKEMSGETVIIQGTIDCYFEEKGNYILLDYKSDYIGDPESGQEIARLAEHYRVQLELYREALEKIRGVRVEEAWLYLFGIDREIQII
jgi:ATP-dependent helicase/nuclease subunit A